MKFMSVIGSAAGFLAASTTLAPAQDMAATITEIETATAKYRDVNTALSEGFIPDPSGKCVTAAAEGLPPEWGGMGIQLP